MKVTMSVGPSGMQQGHRATAHGPICYPFCLLLQRDDGGVHSDSERRSSLPGLGSLWRVSGIAFLSVQSTSRPGYDTTWHGIVWSYCLFGKNGSPLPVQEEARLLCVYYVSTSHLAARWGREGGSGMETGQLVTSCSCPYWRRRHMHDDRHSASQSAPSDKQDTRTLPRALLSAVLSRFWRGSCDPFPPVCRLGLQSSHAGDFRSP
ncbi:hypothetical protein F5B21DRAFT_239397 [Xylaria acuta]|nr:hypothetical protein F5B21DRAFT_239397 [Xylaria acuta]